MNKAKNDFERDGYLIIPNLLTQDQIDALRESLYKHFNQAYELEGLGKHQPNAAVEVPAISWIFGLPSIVSVFRQLFGQDELIFTGNCDAHMNMLSKWHKDTFGCFSEECFKRQNFKIYRAGIYLQDHVIKAGLTVKTASHRSGSLTEGKSETLSTRAGDVVFFDMRLTHAGQFASSFEMLLMGASRRLHLNYGLTALRTRVRSFMRKSDKLSIFFSYTVPSPDAEIFCRYETAAKMRRPTTNSVYLPESVLEGLTRSNVTAWESMVQP